jgi:hypothetical protein
MKPEGSLPCSQKPASSPYTEPLSSRSMLILPLFLCLCRSKESVQKFVTISTSPSLQDEGPRLNATAFSICLQLLSTSGDHIFHPQPKDAPRHGDRDQHNMENGYVKEKINGLVTSSGNKTIRDIY